MLFFSTIRYESALHSAMRESLISLAAQKWYPTHSSDPTSASISDLTSYSSSPKNPPKGSVTLVIGLIPSDDKWATHCLLMEGSSVPWGIEDFSFSFSPRERSAYHMSWHPVGTRKSHNLPTDSIPSSSAEDAKGAGTGMGMGLEDRGLRGGEEEEEERAVEE